MFRQGALVLLMISLASACGRTAMDAGRAPRPEVDGGTPADVPAPADARPTPDAQVSPDLQAPVFGCTALQSLADGVLTSRHAVRALFAPDRSSLVLWVKGEGPSANSVQDDLLLVRLPSGEVSPIIGSIAGAEWLQPGSTLLVRAAQEGRIDLVVVGSDGGAARTLVQDVCNHVAAPDGSRVYAIHDCDKNNYGTLDVIDVASGASTRLALGAGFWTLRPTNAAVVSPDGRWVTFMIGIPTDGGSSQYVLVVAGADGRVETLASQPSAYDAGFVSDRLLLFQTGAWSSEIRGHVPGTGDTSYLVATNRDPGQFGYVVSPDGTRLLGAAMTTEYIYELYAIRLDGSGELLLAPDLVSFQLFEMPIRAFAFSAGGRAIYLSDRPFGVATVSLDGGKPTKLSGGAYFREAPRLDQVALVEPTSLAPAASRLRLVDLEYGTDVFAYDSDGGVETVGFPPSGRDLVFTEYGPPGRTQLRYASADQSGVLGEWMTTQFQPDVSYFAMSLEVHPVDPTGCFTVFDTDLTPGPGTRLAILPPD